MILFLIKGLDDLRHNLAKVEVASSSLVSRSKTSLVVSDLQWHWHCRGWRLGPPRVLPRFWLPPLERRSNMHDSYLDQTLGQLEAFSAALKHQRGVGAAEAETVGHDGVNPAPFGRPKNRVLRASTVKFVDIGGTRDESIAHHE
jgi:hypothetical protein